ncbi:cobalamin-binding protein [Pontibacterium granulatum]|uniref:cobalamin-binding protein n=1 Tax=Pontibacterium granulatum TaxID=2036029 RepID=UPI00249B3889|nr:cobalamin-binding protein [Pontibacterium granulatum]MDI3323224.1 cobalamin-binding protein [Pontibacterium granulatum]
MSEVRVVDDLGRPLVLPQAAKRVISLAPHITENLYSVGAGDQIVAAVSYSDYPEAARALPRVGDFANLNIERILSLNPDLVIAWIDGSSAAQLERLEQLGIPVLRESPDSFAEIANSLRRLGTVTGNAHEAERVAADLEARVGHLRERFQEQTTLTVFYQLWHQPLITSNNSQLIDRIVRLCGGRNIFAERPEIAPRVNIEAVIAADPDVILSGVEKHDPQWRQYWQRWTQMKAVEHGFLFTTDADQIHRATLRALAGAEAVCEQFDQARQKLAAEQHSNKD